LRNLQGQYFEETNAKHKSKLKQQIVGLIQTLSKSDETFDFEIYFGDVFQQQNGFDIVVGNPPYVRQEKLKDIKDRLKKEFDCFVGTADLYVFFYERGLKLLKPHGVLAYITSNKFYRAAYGKKLRFYLISCAKIHQIIDFGDEKVFEAIAYPTVVILEKEQFQKGAFQALVWNKEKPIEQFVEVVETESFSMPQSSLNPNGWQFLDEASLQLLEKLRQSGTPLGEYVGGRFYYGIKTGLNEAFVVDRETRDRLIAEHQSSEKVLKPFIRGREVKRWNVKAKDQWLIFTRRGINIEDFPAIHKYLLQFKDRLKPGVKGGRKAGSYEWFEIQDNIAYWEEFENSKILIPAITDRTEYTADTNGYFGNDKTSICVSPNMYFLLGILNSSLMWWFIKQTAASKQGGFYEFKPMYVKQIPIPDAKRQEKQAISSLVQNCLEAHGTNVSKLEAEIDQLVGRLFNLTSDDWAIINGREKL
jgi:adenine-specific DNA-methyltransferase